MPSPYETELRVHDSPEPTQTVFGFFGSMAIAPIDCTGCLSNTGLKVVPPLTDFQTPPLAAPAYNVMRLPSCTASMAAMRPDIAAEPMLRAPRPEMVSESTVTTVGVGGGVLGVGVEAAACGAAAVGACATATVVPLPGRTNNALAIGTFASIFEYVVFCRFGFPFTPFSIENGSYRPLTSL